MKNFIVKLLVCALRPVVLKIVSEMPKPKTIGDLVKEKAGKEGLTMREFWEKHPYPPKKLPMKFFHDFFSAACQAASEPWSSDMYKFELPIGARISIMGNVFLYSGGGVFVGEKCPLVIECSLSESQLSNATEKNFIVRKYERSNERLAREIYLALGDIPSE